MNLRCLIYRFLTVAASIVLSLPVLPAAGMTSLKAVAGPAQAAPQSTPPEFWTPQPQAEAEFPDASEDFRTGRISDAGRIPYDRAVLTVPRAGGHVAVRTGVPPGGGLAPVEPHAVVLSAKGAYDAVSAQKLKQYRLQNSLIVRSQFRALFPKHWFW